jgi:sarcosine oxidase, subunit gamma
MASCWPSSYRDPSLRITVRVIGCVINLRGSVGDPAFEHAVRDVLGVNLPRVTGGVATSPRAQCLWQGPDEWLVMISEREETRCVAELDDALAGLHHAVTDVTGDRLVIRITGSRALELIARGCSIDLDPEAFSSGRVVNCVFADTLATLVHAEPGEYDVHVKRSYARWFENWFAAAAAGLEHPQ